METTDDLLRTLALEAYRREVEQEESIWRSLPFFATALAFAVNAIGYAVVHLPVSAEGWLRWVALGGIALAAISLGVSFHALVRMVWAREYKTPPDDAAVAAYVDGVRAFHRDQGLDEVAADAKALAALTSFVAHEYGAVATWNRARNARRRQARTQSLVYLLAGLVIALATVVVIYGADEAGAPRAEQE